MSVAKSDWRWEQCAILVKEKQGCKLSFKVFMLLLAITGKGLEVVKQGNIKKKSTNTASKYFENKNFEK